MDSAQHGDGQGLMRGACRRFAFLAVALAGAAAAGCGEAVFTPACDIPARGTLARPAAIAALGDGTYAIANADPDELYCGGYLSYRDSGQNEIRDPQLFEVAEGYEANFAAMATTATRLWLAGRRYGYLLGMRQSDRVVDTQLAGIYADRIFAAGPDYLVAWTGRNLEPQLMWFSDAGQELLRQATSLSPLRATAYDTARRRVWLAYDGANNVQYVDLPDITALTPRLPRGTHAHNIRGMVVDGDIVYGIDHESALLLAWDADSGDALAAEAFGFKPEALAIDAQHRLWVLDAGTSDIDDGAVYMRDGSEWRLMTAMLERPVALAIVGVDAWVLDYAAETITTVPVP